MADMNPITARGILHAGKSGEDARPMRILIVDDQLPVRRGLRMLFAAAADMTVIGEAADSVTALDLAISLHPEIILMEIDMAPAHADVIAKRLRTACPQAALIILSFDDDPPTRELAHAVGAAAFVAKSEAPEVLLATIREVFRTRFGSGKRDHGTIPA
jgi:DNA-binding NarL/FixJ family response regulator